MTTLADEIARAAVRSAQSGVFWAGASERVFQWAAGHPWAWGMALDRAQTLLARTPLHAPRKPPQQPQAPEGGMMPEMW